MVRDLNKLDPADPVTWVTRIQTALMDYRKTSIPEGVNDNDKEWDDICVAWHWIEGEILPTITDLARAKKLMERYPNFKFGGE